MSQGVIKIENREISAKHPPYIVAELSGNHNGDLSQALKIMEVAKKAGADAVKLQTYKADSITIDHDGPEFTISQGIWKGRTLYDVYQEAMTPWEWHKALFKKGKELGITVFSSPFDAAAVEFLETFDVPAYKIASPEIIDLPLIKLVSSKYKPVIISTGMATENEIQEAVDTAREAGARNIILLHCVSAYPTDPKDSNLLVLSELESKFGVVGGLSDHTLGTATAIAAVALGASVIEKHVTLSRASGGIDSDFSIEPDELGALVRDARTAWQALGEVRYGPSISERESLKFRRSLYAVRDIGEGEPVTNENIRSIRPSNGLAPKHLPNIIGKCAVKNIKRGSPISWDLLDRS